MRHLLFQASLLAMILVNPYVYGVAAPVTSYGNSQGSPTITTNITPGSGTVVSINDGVTADGFTFASALTRLQWIQFDFGAGSEQCIDAWKIFTDSPNTGDINGFRWAASNDLVTWVELADLTLGGAVNTYTEYTYTNTKGYRYYILWQLPGKTVTATPKYSDIKFKIDTAAAYSPPTNVAAYSFKFGFKDRTGFMTVSFDGTSGGGTLSNLVDFFGVDNTSDSWFPNGAQANKRITFDFGVGNSFILKETTWFQDNTSNQGSACKIQGSNDGSSWTDLATGLTIGGASVSTFSTSGNTTAYRYYGILLSTTSSSPWVREVLFKGSLT